METTKFYTLSGQPIILMPEKKGKYKGLINIMQIGRLRQAAMLLFSPARK